MRLLLLQIDFVDVPVALVAGGETRRPVIRWIGLGLELGPSPLYRVGAGLAGRLLEDDFELRAPVLLLVEQVGEAIVALDVDVAAPVAIVQTRGRSGAPACGRWVPLPRQCRIL